MRTTLNVDDDVMDLARAVADSRCVSIGKALSDLARKGATARAATSVKHGFHVFAVPKQTRSFGPDEVRAALEAEDAEVSREFFKRRG